MKRKRNKRIVINSGCKHNTPCLYYPNCDRGNSCWYQHLEYESEMIAKKQKLVQKANEIVTPNHELLSQIYQQIKDNNNNSTMNKDNDILFELANKLSVNNSFKILKIGVFQMNTSLTDETRKNATFDGDTISIHSCRDTKVMDILSVIQYYHCKLDEFAVNIWKYPDMHELSFAICSWLPFNKELKKLDLSYFNYGFHQHDFNNICKNIANNLSFIKIFGISGRSQNQSMIRNLYNIIRTNTSLTGIKLKLLRDTNDFGGGGCCVLSTNLLIDGLFENEQYLEMQIDQIQNSLKNNTNSNLCEVCIDEIINFCFGNDVLNNRLKLSVDVNAYGERNHDYFDDYDDYDGYGNDFNSRFERLKTKREINKSIIKRQISFTSSTCIS